MNPAEECLKCLKDQDWTKLSEILTDNKIAGELAESPTFYFFEKILIEELKRYENDSSDHILLVAVRIFQIHLHKDSVLKLSEKGEYKIAKYLFSKNPSEIYAKILIDDTEAIKYLKKHNIEIQKRVELNRISANLNVKIGDQGKLRFDKDIFNNSPQERELYFAARKILPNSILLPNTALSTIIDSKICEYLDPKTTNFFFKSTLDLCIVNSCDFKPEIFIELDSSWHDKPKQIEKDKMKDDIFNKAGLKLERLRKIKNKGMIDIFELFINKNYAS